MNAILDTYLVVSTYPTHCKIFPGHPEPEAPAQTAQGQGEA